MLDIKENCREPAFSDIDSRFVVLFKYDNHVDTMVLSYSEKIGILFNKESFFSPEHYLKVITVIRKYDWKLSFYSRLYFYDNQYQIFSRENRLQKIISDKLREVWYRRYVRAMQKEDSDFVITQEPLTITLQFFCH